MTRYVMNIFKNLMEAIDPLPSSVLCVLWWKWWQFWMTPKIKAISSDIHQLEFIKLHNFKVEIFKSI